MAFRVDFSEGLNVKKRLTELMNTEEVQEDSATPGSSTTPGSSSSPDASKSALSYDFLETSELGGGSEEDEIRSPDDKPLLSGCGVTAGDIRRDHPDDLEKAEKIILVLKLILAHLATGQATVDTEIHAIYVAEALGLGALRVDLGQRHIVVGFGGSSTVHFLLAQRDIVLDKLSDVTDLTILLANGFTNDAAIANKVVDEIMESPGPYGWAIGSFLFWLLSTCAATCAFFGSYYDMAIVAVITVIVAILQQVIAKFPATLGPLDVILVSIVIGICSSFAWRYILDPILGYDICHVSVLFLSPLLVYLPGSQLIYGAYEVKMGNVTAGGTRLIGATVRCMYIASGLTIGWQVFGYHESGTGPSLVPSQQCQPFTSDDITPNNLGPWWLVFGVYNIVLLIGVNGSFCIRPSHFFGAYFVAYPSLLLFGFLNFGCSEAGCGLPSYLINMIGLFVATSLSCIREYLTGTPAIGGLVPVLLVLAPGGSAILSVLKLMQDANGQSISLTGDIFVSLTLLGVSYALGMVLGFAVWTPLLTKRQEKKIKGLPEATARKEFHKGMINDGLRGFRRHNNPYRISR